MAREWNDAQTSELKGATRATATKPEERQKNLNMRESVLKQM
jgi:hypothetical protein